MLLVTGTLVEAPLLRITVEPSPANGLRKTSQIMVDKVMTLPRDKLGPPFGRLEVDTMLQVERCLALFLGIAR
ncbi:putative endoribonuclease MazF [Tepidimonas fonticaldi]|uniref:Putative endoribonuclease MazF n=1 Tax=Tepidimonas fonticaldi TaxID=1101373 RepID=A0A554XFB2_9BURK|nr:putative endoribonuclease MazF [Tepidimonas fonticaldi]